MTGRVHKQIFAEFGDKNICKLLMIFLVIFLVSSLALYSFFNDLYKNLFAQMIALGNPVDQRTQIIIGLMQDQLNTMSLTIATLFVLIWSCVAGLIVGLLNLRFRNCKKVVPLNNSGKEVILRYIRAQKNKLGGSIVSFFCRSYYFLLATNRR